MDKLQSSLFAVLTCFLSGSGNVAASPISYAYTGQITQVTSNPNDVIPNLAIGDLFTGQLTVDSSGWNRTAGEVRATINGVELVFDGEFVYGQVNVVPFSEYSIRIAADTGGDIGDSTFSAFNFGPNLIDSDGSADHNEQFPVSLNLTEFETNDFRIAGVVRSTGDFVNATGTLTSFVKVVPEPSVTFIASGVIVVSLVRRRRT